MVSVTGEEALKNTGLLAPGSGVSYVKFDKPDYRILQTFEAPDGMCVVAFQTDEMTALCPLTGQPDWYSVQVSYMPAEKCVESKSVKLYFGSFRDTGAFIETIAKTIVDDWLEACAPCWVKVDITMKPRGGVAMNVVREGGDFTPCSTD